jgi:hypothetical protein
LVRLISRYAFQSTVDGGPHIRVFSFGHVRHAVRPGLGSYRVGDNYGEEFKPAGTYWQYPVGADRSLRTATGIPIAEAYVFEIAADGIESPLFFSLNVIVSREFEVGQRVQIVYRRRGLAFVWSRIFVEKMVAESR